MNPLGVGSISLRLYPPDLPAVQRVAELRAQAEQAAAAGYDGVMVSEHHGDFPGYLPDPIQLAQFVLAAMPVGWVAPCPLVLALQPYALIAERLAWLDAAYPGRVGAGFAAGALPVDFELAEVPFGEVTERFKAALPKVVGALRGHDDSPLGRDRAIRRLAESPLPMVVAAQSPGAVRRAGGLGLGVLYDSLQPAAVSARLSAAYDAACDTARGAGAKVLIRRVWIGDPPVDEMAAQLAHYRSYAPAQAIANWGTDEQLVHGATGAEAAERLAAVLAASGCNAVNIRVHLAGLSATQVRRQLDLHGEELLPMLRGALGLR